VIRHYGPLARIAPAQKDSPEFGRVLFDPALKCLIEFAWSEYNLTGGQYEKSKNCNQTVAAGSVSNNSFLWAGICLSSTGTATIDNDPQIQLAQDGVAALAQGESIESVVPTTRVDVGHSLAPFVMVFNDQGEVIASSGQLHGSPPELPDGVLDSVKQNGEDRVTWAPEAEVRIAAVIDRYEGTTSGYVLAGRSLREVEVRENQVQFFAGAVWLATMILSLVIIAGGEFFLAT